VRQPTFTPFLRVSISATSYDEEGRAFAEKAAQLRAFADETELGAVQNLYLLLAESYETLAGSQATGTKKSPAQGRG
jgi:hypothetical protein